MTKQILNTVSNESIQKMRNTLLKPVNQLTKEDIEIPQDAVTSIKQARLRNGSIESLIHVEPVTALKGRRVYALNTADAGLEKVGEDSPIPEINQRKMKEVPFEVSKYAGILSMSTELLQDASEQITDFVSQLTANETRVSRNKETFNKLNTLTKTSLTDVNDIKKQMNTTLRRVKRANMNLVTNNDGFEYLDSLTDAAGNPLLKESATANSGFKLFNVDVQVFDNEELPTTDTNMPFIFGDTVEAITLFDRERLEVTQTEHNEMDFFQNRTKFRLKDYFDVQLVASNLLVYGHITKA